MVKKYFRPFIIAVCVMMSVSYCGSGAIMPFAASVDVAASESDEEQYKVILSNSGGTSYSTDSHKDSSLSTSEYDVLLYEAGESVSFEISSDYEYSIIEDESGDVVYRSSDFADGNISFTMPSHDLKVSIDTNAPIAEESESEAVEDTEAIEAQAEAEQAETSATETAETKAAAEETGAGETDVEAVALESETAETIVADTASETEAAQTEASETEATQSETDETEATQTEAAETEATQTEATETEATQTEATETEATQTETTETEAPVTVSDATAPILTYSAATYAKGDPATVTLSGVSSTAADSVTVTYSIPTGTSFAGIAASPAYENADIAIQYQDASGAWNAYADGVDPAQVTAIRYTASRNDGGSGITSTADLVITLSATGAVSADTAATATYTENGQSVEKSGSAHLTITAQAATITISQTPESPTAADEIQQTVSVTYLSAADSKITYTVDPSLDVKSINVGSNTYLEGGKAVITSAAGDMEVDVTASMDLSGYTNVTKIVFTPKISAYEGMEAKFTAVLSLKDSAAGSSAQTPISSYTCSADVWTSVNGYESAENASMTSPVSALSVATPIVTLSYNGKEYSESLDGAIAFGKEFSVNISSVGMSSYNQAGAYECSVTVPSFVTLKEIKLPTLDGASKIAVYGTKDGTETLLGEGAPGDTISVGTSGYSALRFVITSENGTFKTTAAGVISFANDLTENEDGKTQNTSIRATARATIGETEYSAASKILSANIKNYKRTEPDQPQTGGASSGSSSGGTTNGGTTTQTEAPQTETETETENTYDEERKQAEADRKEQIKKESLQNESKMKEIQQTLLAERVSKIQQSAVTTTGNTSTTTGSTSEASATDKYADWDVKPLFEGMVGNLVPEEFKPISESIVSNIIPEDPSAGNPDAEDDANNVPEDSIDA